MNPIPDHLKRFEWYIKHQAWLAVNHGVLRHDPGDAEPKVAILSCEDLHGVDLHEADLRGIAMEGTNLEGASLTEACLRVTDLTRANLTGVI